MGVFKFVEATLPATLDRHSIFLISRILIKENLPHGLSLCIVVGNGCFLPNSKKCEFR